MYFFGIYMVFISYGDLKNNGNEKMFIYYVYLLYAYIIKNKSIFIRYSKEKL